MNSDQESKDLIFTHSGAWLGLVAYIVVAFIVVLTFV